MTLSYGWECINRRAGDYLTQIPLRWFHLRQLGALRFDRDLRSISAFLSAQTSFGGGNAREKLIRLQQMATVLNLGVVRLSPRLPLASSFYVLSCLFYSLLATRIVLNRKSLELIRSRIPM